MFITELDDSAKMISAYCIEAAPLLIWGISFFTLLRTTLDACNLWVMRSCTSFCLITVHSIEPLIKRRVILTNCDNSVIMIRNSNELQENDSICNWSVTLQYSLYIQLGDSFLSQQDIISLEWNDMFDIL